MAAPACATCATSARAHAFAPTLNARTPRRCSVCHARCRPVGARHRCGPGRHGGLVRGGVGGAHASGRGTRTRGAAQRRSVERPHMRERRPFGTPQRSLAPRARAHRTTRAQEKLITDVKAMEQKRTKRFAGAARALCMRTTLRCAAKRCVRAAHAPLASPQLCKSEQRRRACVRACVCATPNTPTRRVIFQCCLRELARWWRWCRDCAHTQTQALHEQAHKYITASVVVLRVLRLTVGLFGHRDCG
jgi:hypothetical protein